MQGKSTPKPPAAGERIAVLVQPKASKNQVEGPVPDAAGKQWLKIRVTAAPEDGKANDAVIRLLADYWSMAPSRLEVASGHTNRRKLIQVS